MKKVLTLSLLLLGCIAIIFFVSNSKQNLVQEETADLNNNNIEENYKLEQGVLKIYENSEIIWQSSRDWWVDSFVLADSTNDGITDINLSVWRAGNFGSSKPFWVEKNDMSTKNHFFIFDFRDGRVQPIWQSSNLEVPNCHFIISDVNGDGKNELKAFEGDYLQSPECIPNTISLWGWNGWGFSKISSAPIEK